MVGIDEARRIITRFGYFGGQNDASTMQRSFIGTLLRI
ncbi:XylR N-terminal domain-containing protein [candidate division KSB1 bacterium]